MNLVQFKRHDGDGDVFINPAHVAMAEQSGTGDANVTDGVVAAQAGAGVRSRPRTPTDPTRRWTMRRASQTAATDEPGPLLLQLPVLLAAHASHHSKPAIRRRCPHSVQASTSVHTSGSWSARIRYISPAPPFAR